MSCLDSELVEEGYIESMKREYGEESDVYAVRVLGQFPLATSNQFIPSNVARAAAGKHLREDEYAWAPAVLGVDVARFGNDKSVVVLRKGLYSRVLNVESKIDTVQLAGIVTTVARTHGVRAIFVDDNGVGAGVTDRLRSVGYEPYPVQFGGKAGSAHYLNKRAECWGLMKAWLQSGAAIPNDEKLLAELTSPQFSFTASNKLQLERKDDMKKRGLDSPDIADALALTFASPIGETAIAVGAASGPAMAKSEYNPFA